MINPLKTVFEFTHVIPEKTTCRIKIGNPYIVITMSDFNHAFCVFDEEHINFLIKQLEDAKVKFLEQKIKMEANRLPS